MLVQCSSGLASVHPITHWYCTETAPHVMQSTPHGSQGLKSSDVKDLARIPVMSPPMDAKYRWSYTNPMNFMRCLPVSYKL